MRIFVLVIASVLPFCSTAQWNFSGGDIYSSNAGGVNIGIDNDQEYGYGTRLSMVGASSNTDPIWLARFNFAPNQSELRINIGDDYGGNEDSFVVGTHHWANGFWYPHLSVHASGRVGIGVTHPDSELTVLGSAHFLSFQPSLDSDIRINYLNGNVLTGLLSDVYSSSGYPYGIAGIATTHTGYAAGVYGSGQSTGGQFSYAGYFNGNLGYTGQFGHISDERFKNNILNLDNSLSRIMKISAKEYEFKKIKGYNFPEGKRAGFIAQQLQEVFPELVFPAAPIIFDDDSVTSAVEYLSVDYTSLIPHIVKAIQEQNKIIEDSRNQILSLQDFVVNASSQLPSDVLKEIPRILELFPNPATSIATVRIHNPTSENASIVVKDKNGTVRLKQTFLSSDIVEFSIAELENGVFLVELVIGNKTFDLKRFLVLK